MAIVQFEMETLLYGNNNDKNTNKQQKKKKTVNRWTVYFKYRIKVDDVSSLEMRASW